MRNRIDAYYDPENAENELGWIWDKEAHERGEVSWRLCCTFWAGGEDDGLTLRLIDTSGEDDETYPADEWRGAPYMPMRGPQCDPGAALMVTVHLEDGAIATWTYQKDEPATDAARAAVLGALTGRATS